MAKTLDDVEYRVKILPEDMPYQGNCSAIDEETDAQTEAWIQKQLDSGNQAAWCYVQVDASLDGFLGTVGVGGCSYESEEAIEAQLVPELKAEALEDLRTTLERNIQEAERAKELLQLFE